MLVVSTRLVEKSQVLFRIFGDKHIWGLNEALIGNEIDYVKFVVLDDLIVEWGVVIQEHNTVFMW